MKIKVHCQGLAFDVPCGEGEQSMRWLGVVAAQRYSLMLPQGRTRLREQAHSKRGFYLPHNVSSRMDGDIVHPPHARINEILQDGAEVTVTLQNEVDVDELGAPVVSEWAAEAFCHIKHVLPTASSPQTKHGVSATRGSVDSKW